MTHNKKFKADTGSRPVRFNPLLYAQPTRLEMGNKMEIRFAKKEELEKVNLIRKQVSDLHSEGRPDIFYPDFKGEICNCIYDIFNDETKKIIVAVEKAEICGMAIIQEIRKPAGVYQKARDYIEIDQFGVKDTFRRQGVATKLIDFIKEYARAQGFPKLELNMWEFNQDALAFYEAVGFNTYRRYMELEVRS